MNTPTPSAKRPGADLPSTQASKKVKGKVTETETETQPPFITSADEDDDDQLVDAGIVYWGAFSYRPSMSDKALAKFNEGLLVPMGISPTTLEVIALEKSPQCEDSDTCTQTTLSGGAESAVLRLNIFRSPFDNITHPFSELCQEDLHENIRRSVNGLRIPRPLEITPSVIRENIATLMDQWNHGGPLIQGSHLLYKSVDNTVVRLDGENAKVKYPRNYLFSMKYKAFVIDISHLPSAVMDILLAFRDNNPRYLMAPAMLVQKALQWIHINNQELLGLESEYLMVFRDRKDFISYFRVPFTTLEEFLVMGHYYEAFHQHYRLAFYIHPNRFVTATRRMHPLIMDHSSTKIVPIPAQDKEKLLQLLTPMTAKPLGRILPCSWRGSSITHLATAENLWLSRENQAYLKATAIPDCRSLYFPTLPFWTSPAADSESKENTTVIVSLTRKLRVPSTWLSKTVVLDAKYANARPSVWKELLTHDQPRVFWKTSKASAQQMDARKQVTWMTLTEKMRVDYAYYLAIIFPMVLAMKLLENLEPSADLEGNWLAGASGAGRVTRDKLERSMKTCIGSLDSSASDEIEGILQTVQVLPKMALRNLKAFVTRHIGVPACVPERLKSVPGCKEWMDQLDEDLKERYGRYDEANISALQELHRAVSG